MTAGPVVRYVVLHRPGPAWEPGTDPRRQSGLEHHVGHYAALHEQGKLEMGGPFLDPDSGGMMVATADVTRGELEDFAAADPAVASGLLEYEVKEWYVPMHRLDRPGTAPSP